MHNGNESLTSKERREFFVCDAFCRKTTQQRGGYQHNSNPRVRQAPIYGAEQRRSQTGVFLAKPDLDTKCLKPVMQVLRSTLPVIPSMAEKHVPKVGLGCALLDVLSDWRKRPHLCIRVEHWRT